MAADQAVLTAGGRCDQENLVAQLKGGVHALTTPVDNLVSNCVTRHKVSTDAMRQKVWTMTFVVVTGGG